MKVLGEFDAKDYGPDGWTFFREAVRAIILRGAQIALVYSDAEHYYKFPGGGIEPGESHLEALCREVREETGLCVKPDSVQEFGMVHERRKGGKPGEIFEQNSYYYLVQVADGVSAQELDDYEAELGYHLVWTDIQTAWEANTGIAHPRYDFVRREAYVLGLLLQG